MGEGVMAGFVVSFHDAFLCAVVCTIMRMVLFDLCALCLFEAVCLLVVYGI